MKHIHVLVLKVSLILFSISFSPCYATDSTYKEIVNQPGYNKDALYSAARLTMVKMFNSAKDVIQADDRTGGFIAGKGFYTTSKVDKGTGFPKTINYEYKIWFILNITVKDERYKIELSDFSIEQRTSIPGQIDGGWMGPMDIQMIKDAVEGKNKQNNKYLQKIEVRARNVCKWLLKEIDTRNKATMEDFKQEISENLKQPEF